VIARGFRLRTLAAGADPLENPSAKITNYGLLADGTRTEPDQNLYLILDHVSGPTPGYNYDIIFCFKAMRTAVISRT
jgi:hypothetical protein